MSTIYFGTFHCLHGNYGDPSDKRDVDVFASIREAETKLREKFESVGRYSVVLQHADGTASDQVYPLVQVGDYYRLFPVETDASKPGYVESTDVLIESIISGEWSPSHTLTIGPREGVKIERH